MNPAEIEALVEQVGDEILGRLKLPGTVLQTLGAVPQASPNVWPRPEGGYASCLELVCASADATASDVRRGCERAREAGIPVVWTPTSLLPAAVAELSSSEARAGALIDFPGGASSTPARLADIETALRLGAAIINLTLGAGRSRAEADVLEAELRAAVSLCRDAGAPLAVTLEEALLPEADLRRAAAAALAAGADAICTSTGAFSHAFASDSAVASLRQAAGSGAVVIAAGAIAGFGHAAALAAAGADRIATDDPWAVLDAAPAR
jgi:deoxyribose-phosphate aldolase